MNTQISLQERLKDLRVERGLGLQELAEQTQISRSALGNYENDDYKEINHGNLVILADFYDVTVDYLLGRTDIRKHGKTPIKDLNLSDDAVDLLMSGRINNRLLCELITHEKFAELMADTEIYVDGIVTGLLNDLNTALEHLRSEIIEQTPEAAADRTMRALEAAQIQEEDFFCNATHKSWDKILHDIRKKHEPDNETAEEETLAQKQLKKLTAATTTITQTYRDPAPPFTDIFCSLFHLENKVSDDEKHLLTKIFRRSDLVNPKRKKKKR